MSHTSRKQFSWHTLAIVLATGALLWWFLRGVDFGKAWQAVQRAHLLPISIALVVTLQTYVIRAWRWQVLLEPLGGARFWPAFRTTVIGFTATNLLPARPGEVLRPYLLARHEDLDAAAAFATVIIERVLDLAAVVLLFGFFLLTSSIDVGNELRVAGGIATVASLVGLAIMAASAGHPEKFGGWAASVLRILPARFGGTLTRFIHAFMRGLAVMRRPTALFGAFAFSIALWLSIALGVWLCSWAVGVQFAYSGSFLVLMFLVAGVAVPVPAGVGSFHAAYIYAVVTFFAADNSTASAAAAILHAVSFGPITILGLVLMAREGLTLTGMQRMKSTAEAAEGKGLPS